MNDFLVHWATFLFMVGLLLSLPLGAVFYLNNPHVKQFFTNARKLKAAHLDFILQAFSIGLVLLVELATLAKLPLYAVIPLAFGTFCNPFIFLLEATPLYQTGFTKTLYRVLRAASPTALFFAWSALAFQLMPAFVSWLLLAFMLLLVTAFLITRLKTKEEGGEKIASSKTSI
ncbi:hypothetical protein [Planomicrobium sp. CPCC 101110]|uniref:hypothetical protein n=1 Tax=Planomicrobium sp. CPCC 101110 TaxID=2599619 RepID=UPI0011B5C82B|nr:hypothetical protein [Planomicrobium sp. CPCC 101110]TWT25847.1 hypothetical protein FQV30_08600 [Planomicrobium sp. CPCC 101110]